jgi:hypothetical protein
MNSPAAPWPGMHRMATSFQFKLGLPLCVALVTLSGCCTTSPPVRHEANGISNDDPTRRIDFLAAETRLRQGLQSGDVDRLIVLQIDRHKSFRTSVSSMALERWYDYALDNRRLGASRVCADFLAALERARPVPSDRLADLRWGFIFCARDGQRLFSVYCDAAGTQGVIDGACYMFEVGSLAEFGESLFPTWMK